jgi:NodT family efflux transporter outer membrane factor (OMF) lipoprotein
MPFAAVPPTPSQFRAAPSRPAAALGEWPKVFGSPELVRLTRAAEAQNFDIAAATARIRQAQAQAQIAGSSLYPQVSFGEDATRSLSPGTLRSKEPPFVGSVGNRFSLGLSASYVVDLFGRNRALVEAADLGVEASRFERDTISVATIASVANLYLQVLAAQDRRRVAQENIRTADQVLQAIRARLTVGTGTELDIAQQESVLNSQKASIPALDQLIQQNRTLLAVLVGRTPESLRVEGGSLDRLKVPTVQPGLPAQLLVRRPDIAASEQRLSAQNASVEAARLAFLPQISLTGGASLESITLKNLLRPEALAASLAQGLTQPIFDGGNLRGQLELARGREIELLEDYRKTIVTALSDVENALIAVQQSVLHERLQLAVVASARRASQITQERLREGTIDVVTLLNTQLTLFQAQDQLTQVRLQKFQAYVSLFQSLGGGWHRELVILADPSVPEGPAK